MSSYIFNFKKFFFIFVLIFLSTILIFVIGSEILIRGSLKSSVNIHKELKQKLDSSVKSIALFADSRGANGIIENEKIANFSLHAHVAERTLHRSYPNSNLNTTSD